MELEKKLQEELNRYRAINKYTKTMVMEQEIPPPPADPAAAPPEGGLPPDPGAPADAGALPPPPPADAGMGSPVGGDTTEEIDITDLVDMVKSIKKDQDDSKGDTGDVMGQMDAVFTKLSDLEQKLSQMDSVLMKIDQLGSKVESMREKTPQEKLEMRSLDSYPFSQNPQEFFSQKQGEMKASGKNEYVLTKQEVNDYSKDMIKNTFNPEVDQDEFKF